MWSRGSTSMLTMGAVRACRYKDVEEGISATIGYYLTGLASLKRSKNLQIFVQPVAPVLNETRRAFPLHAPSSPCCSRPPSPSPTTPSRVKLPRPASAVLCR